MSSIFQRPEFTALEVQSGRRWQRPLDWLGPRIQQAGTRWWLLVAAYALLVYLLTRVLLPGRLPPELFLYLLQPLLWLSLALLAGLGLAYELWERPAARPGVILKAGLIGVTQIAVFLIAGLLFGFGRSPYSHQPLALLGNLFYVFAMLVGIEVCRAYLANASPERGLMKVLLLISLFCALLYLPLGTFTRLDGLQAAAQVAGERLLPAFAQSLLATFLVVLAGPLASIAYLGSLLAFEWLSPLLPNPGWFINSMVGTLVPAIALLMLYNQYASAEGSDTEEDEEEDATTAWIVVGVLSVLILGFSTGLFGYQPTLIGSGSMTPALQVGDIVVVRRLPIETIQVGDIVRFREGRDSVVHRVVAIQHERGQTVLITRGDDNDSNDPPVIEQAYEGKVVFTLPVIGWVGIFVREGLALFR